MEQDEYVRMATYSYFAFLSIVAAVHFTPGPVMMTLSMQTMNRGLKAGLLTFAGVELAELVLVSVVVLGFSSASANIVYVMRWLAGAGIAYLFYAAICAWRAKLYAPQRVSSFGNSPFLNGFAVTVGDPVSLLFYGALFPQFVDWQRPVAPQLMVLVISYFAFAIVFDATLVLLCSRVQKMKNFDVSAHAKKFVNAVAVSLVLGVVLIMALGNYLDIQKNAATNTFVIAAKGDLVLNNRLAHSEADVVTLLGANK